MTFHLLPPTHPARTVLEHLFSCSRVIRNESTFHEAGFVTHVQKLRSLMRVAIHPALPEYIFKVFLVDERQCEREKPRGWKSFHIRCIGAERIRRIIQERRVQHFQVPRKWLFYPAHDPSCSVDDQPMILVAEYEDLVSRQCNEHAWFSGLTESHLDELYTIIDCAGGASYRPDNIPLTKKGTFSFIDTEHSCERPDYDSIVPYLSPRMRRYWTTLIQSGSK
jgi:hypothetical protein